MIYNWGQGLGGAASGAATGDAAAGPWGALAGGAAGALGGFMDDPSEKANKFLEQVPDTLKPYFEPYFNAGKEGLNKFQGASNEMLNDPNSIIQRLGSGFRQSPGYQWNLNQQEQQIANAQAAGGMAGSNQHQQNAGELAGHLADQDFQEYLNHVLGLYGTGVQGQQSLANMGQTAGTDLGTSLGNNLMSQAGLGYEGGASRNKNISGLLSSLLASLQNPNKNTGNSNGPNKNTGNSNGYKPESMTAGYRFN